MDPGPAAAAAAAPAPGTAAPRPSRDAERDRPGHPPAGRLAGAAGGGRHMGDGVQAPPAVARRGPLAADRYGARHHRAGSGAVGRVTMYVQVVNFNLKDTTDQEYRALCDQDAPVFGAMPGLIAKYWLADPETNTYGG